jgi:hypothetical protein
MTGTRLARDDGVALLLALVALMILSVVGAAVVLTTSSDVLIAGSFRDQREAVDAADAIVARAFEEIGAFADWSVLLAGAVSPTLADGPPVGTRQLDSGVRIDLRQVVNRANCQNAGAACTVADMDAVTDRRPWGTANPRWQLYAYEPLGDLLPEGAAGTPWYVVLLVADDPLRSDKTIALRGEAFGPRNAHAVVEVLAARLSGGDSDYNGDGLAPMSLLYWREVR